MIDEVIRIYQLADEIIEKQNYCEGYLTRRANDGVVLGLSRCHPDPRTSEKYKREINESLLPRIRELAAKL